jgi:hypothetical protein
VIGQSVSEPEFSSSSSQESAMVCFFRKAEEDLEGCGFIDSFVREASRSGWC